MLRLYLSDSCRILFLLDRVLLLSPTYSESGLLTLVLCNMKPERLKGSNWKHVLAELWPWDMLWEAGEWSLWKGRDVAGLQSHSLPVKTEGHFWVCLLGLWMEKAVLWDCLRVKPLCFVEGQEELSGGTSSWVSAEGKGAPLIQRVTSSGSVRTITLKSPPAICLLCVLHNQVFLQNLLKHLFL